MSSSTPHSLLLSISLPLNFQALWGNNSLFFSFLFNHTTVMMMFSRKVEHAPPFTSPSAPWLKTCDVLDVIRAQKLILQNAENVLARVCYQLVVLLTFTKWDAQQEILLYGIDSSWCCRWLCSTCICFQSGLTISQDSRRLLKSFCNYQKRNNPGVGDSRRWNHAFLVTG